MKLRPSEFILRNFDLTFKIFPCVCTGGVCSFQRLKLAGLKKVEQAEKGPPPPPPPPPVEKPVENAGEKGPDEEYDEDDYNDPDNHEVRV